MKRGREEGWKKEEECLCEEWKVFIKVSDTETGSFYFDGQTKWHSPRIQIVPAPSIMINQCSYLTLTLFEYHPCGYEESNSDGKFSEKGDWRVNGSISPWIGERLVQNLKDWPSMPAWPCQSCYQQGGQWQAQIQEDEKMSYGKMRAFPLIIVFL